MSGGYFVNGNIEWTAEDVGEFAEEMKKRDESSFVFSELYRDAIENYPVLEVIADDPARIKRRVIGELEKIKTGLAKAAAFLKAVDAYAAGDTGTDTFLLDLEEIKDKYGNF